MYTFLNCAAHYGRPKALHVPTTSCAASRTTPVEQQISRRALTLKAAAALGAVLCGVNAADAEPIFDNEILVPIRTVDLGNGVRVEEVADGTGPEVEVGSQVSVRWVLRRSNGYFIDASYGFGRFEDLTYTAGQGSVIPAFETAVLGMRAGGRRRFIAPPQLSYVAGTKPGCPGPIPPSWGARRSLDAHRNENLVFEVHVVKVRPPRK